ncbi:alpha/beta fold hydrolase [Streptomyces sp. SP18CS02]|uniref:alpha/beta fold hydrolase n=1 Tax=Streptomyces sp. SP18CS02 TaxID=3002531 RepID=UPI002E79763B|nr:alpha/beta fold hydrolase [Streptomyces sp. SP18CS02]MEE1754056.1 alpha/beta fold hydrolase [Streptomyces sp. SP18CS02]
MSGARLLLASLLALSGAPAPPAAAAPAPEASVGESSQDTVRRAAITMADGTSLAATVHQPPGPGPHPLLVVPGAWWVMPLDMLLDRNRSLARAGYTVVAYDPRGLRRSGGEIDMAGPVDVADAATVVTWALDHTTADPRRVGMLASSYGAALALNAAAHDRRVSAVAALCPWTDLNAAYLPGDTRAASVSSYQELFGRLNGRLSPATRQAFDRMRTGAGADPLRTWARERSPLTHAARLNAHGTAVFLSGEWSDPLVPAGQTGALLDALTGPRQLWMNPGGHGDSSSAESELLDSPARTRHHALAWLDHHLRAVPNGADRLPPLLVRPRDGARVETYPGWAALERSRRPVAVRPPGASAATLRLVAGADSPADSGAFPVSGLLDGAGLPPTTFRPLLGPPVAAVWHSSPLPRPWALRGSPHLDIRFTPSAGAGGFVVHLYDVDPLGTARLLTHQPRAFRAVPGTPVRASLALPATAWTVPAGHRVALVIDTADHRYATGNPVGALLDFDAASARLSLPTAHDTTGRAR